MKSSRCSDEIVRFAHDEIKSVLQPDEVGFHHEVISFTKWIYHVCKDGFSRKPDAQASGFLTVAVNLDAFP